MAVQTQRFEDTVVKLGGLPLHCTRVASLSKEQLWLGLAMMCCHKRATFQSLDEFEGKLGCIEPQMYV